MSALTQHLYVSISTAFIPTLIQHYVNLDIAFICQPLHYLCVSLDTAFICQPWYSICQPWQHMSAFTLYISREILFMSTLMQPLYTILDAAFIWQTLYNICQSKQSEWDGWAHKPGLTHLSLVHNPGPSGIVCALSIAIVLYKIDPLLVCRFYLNYLVFLNSLTSVRVFTRIVSDNQWCSLLAI